MTTPVSSRSPIQNPLLVGAKKPDLAPIIPKAIEIIHLQKNYSNYNLCNNICSCIEDLIRAIVDCIVEIAQSIFCCTSNNKDSSEHLEADKGDSSDSVQNQSHQTHTRTVAIDAPTTCTAIQPAKAFGLQNVGLTCFGNSAFQLIFRSATCLQQLTGFQTSAPVKLDEVNDCLKTIWHDLFKDLPSFVNGPTKTAVTYSKDRYKSCMDEIEKIRSLIKETGTTQAPLDPKRAFKILQHQQKLLYSLYDFSGSLLTLAYLAKTTKDKSLDNFSNPLSLQTLQNHITSTQNTILACSLIELRKLALESSKIDRFYERKIQKLIWETPGIMDFLDKPRSGSSTQTIDNALFKSISILKTSPFDHSLLARYIKTFFNHSSIASIFKDVKTNGLSRYCFRPGKRQQDAHEFITAISDRLGLSELLGFKTITQRYNVQYTFNPTSFAVHLPKAIKDDKDAQSFIASDLIQKKLIKSNDAKKLIFNTDVTLSFDFETPTKDASSLHTFKAPDRESDLQDTILETCIDEHIIDAEPITRKDPRTIVRSSASYVKKYFYLEETSEPPQELISLLSLFSESLDSRGRFLSTKQRHRKLTNILEPIQISVYHGDVKKGEMLNPEKLQIFTYEPAGFVCHSGPSIDSGHYIFYHKEADLLVCYNDDATPMTTSFASSAAEQIRLNAYVASYRLKVKETEDNASSGRDT